MWRSIVKHLSGIVIFSIIFYVAQNFRKFWGPIKRRPYLCEDSSIKGPYLKDTINSTTLYVIGLWIPLAVIALNEFLQHSWIQRRKYKNFKWFQRFGIHLSAALLPFLYGFATERLLKNIGKFTVARLWPHFYTVCQPLTSKGVECLLDPVHSSLVYVSEYTCSAPGSARDSTFSSFPSGHSSLTFYGMISTIIYLQRYSKGVHRNVTSYGLLLPLLQLSCLALAHIVSVSRVFDFKHFWSDVFAGAALGTFTAAVFSFYREKHMKEIVLDWEKAWSENYVLSQVKTLNEESMTKGLDQVRNSINGQGVFKETGCSIEMVEN